MWKKSLCTLYLFFKAINLSLKIDSTVSGQDTVSQNTGGRKTIGHKTTESNYQTVKLPDGQNTRGLGNQVMYHGV